LIANRKIGRHHLAFYRGWLQGLDLGQLADRYLESGLDLRKAKSTLSWIRDTFCQAALRNGEFNKARLLRLRLAQSNEAENVKCCPTLDEFREERDPDGFYREGELIELYLEEFPDAASKRTRQRQRLIERQIESLFWIEQLLVTSPVPDDMVAAWFEKPTADRLMIAGIPNLAGLLDRIKTRGYRWWMTVPRLGEKGAARIIAWLQGYESSLGTLPANALLPLCAHPPSLLIKDRAKETAIVPLESLFIPESLSGEAGSNRNMGFCRIEASNDHQAILSWLATKSGSAHTVRAYRKEAERILLWAIIERGKALSDLSIDDCTAYRDWLSMLGRTPTEQWNFRINQETWIGQRHIHRFNPAWRPFDGPLSVNSVRYAINITASLFEWLVRVQYCTFNPWAGVGKVHSNSDETPPDLELTRVLSVAQWNYLTDYLNAMSEDERTSRLRFVLTFAHATGMRLSELVDAKTGRFYTMPLRDQIGMRWMLKVKGKGDKWRAVPIAESLIELFGNYLSSRALNRDPFANPPDTPVIATVGSDEVISANWLYKIIRDLFSEVADSLDTQGNVQDAKTFRKASVHWLRHSCGSHLASSGVPVSLIQKLLGHSSLETTSIYTTADEESLWAGIANRELNHAT